MKPLQLFILLLFCKNFTLGEYTSIFNREKFGKKINQSLSKGLNENVCEEQLIYFLQSFLNHELWALQCKIFFFLRILMKIYRIFFLKYLTLGLKLTQAYFRKMSLILASTMIV